MNRREFIGVAASGSASLLWQGIGVAQSISRSRLVGVLMGFAQSDPEGQVRIGALRSQLRELGWLEGRDIRFDMRWVEGAGTEAMSRQAGDIVRMSPDVIVGNGARAVAALLGYTQSIPIVFAVITDPVGQGFVQTLARPGGNVTGFSQHEFLAAKLIEILKEAAPHLARIVYLHSPNLVGVAEDIRRLKEFAPSVQVEIDAMPVSNAADIERAIAGISDLEATGMIVAPDAVLQTHGRTVISAANSRRIPTLFTDHSLVADGGLMSYGTDRVDQYRQVATYVHRILKGESPAGLPVQLPIKFVLALNLKTAKEIGLQVSSSLLARAELVFE